MVSALLRKVKGICPQARQSKEGRQCHPECLQCRCQSSLGQVIHNQESQRRQYGLLDRAHELGFSDVIVIDDDLGRSGSGLWSVQDFSVWLPKCALGKLARFFALKLPVWHAMVAIGTI
jgi:hypothetical protein